MHLNKGIAVLLVFLCGTTVQFWESRIQNNTKWNKLSRSHRSKSLQKNRKAKLRAVFSHSESKTSRKAIGLKTGLALAGGAALLGAAALGAAALFGGKKNKDVDPNAGLKAEQVEQRRKLADLKYYVSSVLVKKDSLLAELTDVMSALSDKVDNIESKAKSGSNAIGSAVVAITRKPFK